MSEFQKLLLVALGLCVGVYAWLNRYTIVPVARGGDGTIVAGYALDRWTGEVSVLFGAQRRPVKPVNDETP